MAALCDGLRFEHALSAFDVLSLRELISFAETSNIQNEILWLVVSLLDSVDPHLTLSMYQPKDTWMVGYQDLFHRLADNVEFFWLSTIHLAYHGIDQDMVRTIQWTVFNETSSGDDLRQRLTTAWLDEGTIQRTNDLLQRSGWPSSTVLSSQSSAWVNPGTRQQRGGGASSGMVHRGTSQ